MLVLTGEGRAFSAGGDFQGMLQAMQTPAGLARSVAHAPHLVRSVLSLDKPTIARVNGHAMGLGATLALLCDVVFAAEDARIADSHVKVGLAAGDGGALIWPHLVGYARARHHLLTGDALTGAEGLALFGLGVFAEDGAFVRAPADAELTFEILDGRPDLIRSVDYSAQLLGFSASVCEGSGRVRLTLAGASLELPVEIAAGDDPSCG